MIAINWYVKRKGIKTVVGEQEDIIELAHILETSKIQFKITSVDIHSIPKCLFRQGEFEYWLDQEDKFNFDN